MGPDDTPGRPPSGPPALGPPAFGPSPGNIPYPGYGPPPQYSPPPARPPSRQPTGWERFVAHFRAAPVSVSLVVVTVAVWLTHEALITWAHINTDLSLQDNGMAIHGQWWRLITPLVVHYGIVHIGFNMWALWVIGPPVERVIGRWVFLGSYLLSGIAGQVVSDLHYGIGQASGGASGAVYGVVGLLIGNYVVTSRAEGLGRRSTQGWRFNASAAKSLAVQGAVWIVATSLLVPGIDNWAHIGGVAVGLVVGGAVAGARTEPAH